MTQLFHLSGFRFFSGPVLKRTAAGTPRWLTSLFSIGGLLIIGALQQPSTGQGQLSASSAGLMIKQYCLTCHNDRVKTAGLTLSAVNVENVKQNPEVWEKVLAKLQAGAMPPAGVPRPDQASYVSFVAYLQTALDTAAAAVPRPGRPAIHRLNRAEYANAIRDLLSVDIDAESLLPADDSGYGFDNIADVLSVSPTLLERYVSAAGKISRLAIGDSSMRPALATYDVPPLLMQDERISEDMPFGSRGGTVIHHSFPLDGEYVIKIRLQRDPSDHIIGLAEPQQLDVRVDGTRIKLFTVGGALSPKTPSKRVEDRFYDRRESTEQNKYETLADAGIEVRFTAKAGPRLVAVTFLDETREPEGALQAHMLGFYAHRKVMVKGFGPAVAKVTIAGPFNAKGPGDTPSRRKIFVCRATGSSEEELCAKKILSTLARRAYRRPVTDEDVRRLLALYKVGRSEGDFEAGIGMALQEMLVNPEFLFRIERDPAGLSAGVVYRISDRELASRLSFFLWSSIPDEELLAAAEGGKLKDPSVLGQQVRRMLRDSRSNALVDNFAGQWLYVRNMTKVSPDLSEFPIFDENLREAFKQETELFLETTLHEDRSVLDLLNAKYTFLNERLAKFYGIPDVHGGQFRRVALNGHDERRGLLGQGSILTVTSYANRTAPTLRGKWLLANILGTPPPPPPPDVPALKDSNETGKVLPMRERMEEHRKNPACAGCHARMDPLGFALENFDAIGKWRTRNEDGTPVNSSGVLPDGTTFDGPAGLREVLVRHPEQFVSTVAARLLTYGLGRGLEYYDNSTVRKITREAAASDYNWSSLILAIVNSTPFQMRMTKPLDSSNTKSTATQIETMKGTKP